MSDFKVGIIGIGHVGAHVLYTLAINGVADDFVLVDLEENKAKVQAERQDVLDASEFLPHSVNIKVGEIEDLGDRDVIVISVGNIIALKGTHTRLSEMEFNMHALFTFAQRLKETGFAGVLINISNPCDIITKWLNDILKLPKGRVFGTGTGLDSARLKLRIAEKTGIDVHSISAYMLGEHGNEQIAAWSAVNFNGQPLSELLKSDSSIVFDEDEIEKEAREGGWVTYNGKYCTEYAIASTAYRLVKAVRYDEKLIVPASAELDGEFGERGLFAGVPVRLSRNGVEKVIEIPLNDREKSRFHDCCEGIRKNIEISKEYFK